MRSFLLFSLILFFSLKAQSHETPLIELAYDDRIVRDDVTRILKNGGLHPEIVDFKFVGSDTSVTRFICKDGHRTLFIKAPPREKTSAVYKGLRELGFVFPHPLKQITPTIDEIDKKCGQQWSWNPALKYRGLHFHTLHPNEFVAAFYENKKELSDSIIRWLARNQFNIFDFSLLDAPLPPRILFELARAFQIHPGVSLGIALNQQNSYKILSLWDSYLGFDTDKKIQDGLFRITKEYPLSFLVIEAGTSEFTPTDYDKTIRWFKLAGKFCEDNKVAFFTKIHVSTNQFSQKWGNYNFLPQFTDKNVGILPHTVMFYGLLDEKAPMYGNKNFHAIRDFMLKEKIRRPTWYYPETSYWVGMDVDVPLFLTDYLRTRAQDMKYLIENGIEGQLNFTSGHALGYWLFDWTLGLLNDQDYNFDPLTGLKLIGEDISGWKKILNYQETWYKDQGLIGILSSANLQDELSSQHRIHKRMTMKDLSSKPSVVKQEVELLLASIDAFPDIEFIKDKELKTLLRITKLRHEHALLVRMGFSDKSSLDKAAKVREKAQKLINELTGLSTNYPELLLFKEWKNPTAYQFGYVYPAATMYFWAREENQVKFDSYFPFWGNIYDVFDIVF